jgi:hypothetical protein
MEPRPPAADDPSDAADRGTEGSGFVPGLSSLAALRTARQTLEAAEARLASIVHEQHELEREAVTWQQTADRMRGLIAYYEARLLDQAHKRPDPVRVAEITDRGRPQVATIQEETSNRISVERFGRIVTPVADALIAARRRPVPVEQIYAALPEEVRRELDAASSVYSTPFRIRRMFRRNKKYKVTDEGITLAQATPSRATVKRIVRRTDGGIAAFTIIDDESGSSTDISPTDLRATIRAGKTITLPGHNGRRSQLRLAGERFYSECNGTENDDFFSLPYVFQDETAS